MMATASCTLLWKLNCTQAGTALALWLAAIGVQSQRSVRCLIWTTRLIYSELLNLCSSRSYDCIHAAIKSWGYFWTKKLSFSLFIFYSTKAITIETLSKLNDLGTFFDIVINIVKLIDTTGLFPHQSSIQKTHSWIPEKNVVPMHVMCYIWHTCFSFS